MTSRVPVQYGRLVAFIVHLKRSASDTCTCTAVQYQRTRLVMVFTLKRPDCYYHTDVDDLIRPQLPVYIIPEVDSDLLPESTDADVFILDASCPYL